jgi:4-methylaminobutanoate oxidase (formaldehyde-forming)
MNDLPKNLPVLRDYNDCLYLKEDAGKMLVGIFEPGAKNAFKEKGIVPNDFSFGEFPDDFDHFEPYLEKSFKRLPLLENAGIRKFFSGPESFTPDTQYLLGETQKFLIYLHVVVLIVLELQAQEEQAELQLNG